MATPHVLAFSNDISVNPSVAGQSDPTIASGWDGTPLFLAWVENDKVMTSRSDDRGVAWANPVQLWGQGVVETNPTLTFRRRITQSNPDTGELEILVQPALFATIVVDGVVKFFRGDFPSGPTGPIAFSSPIDLGIGEFPAGAAYGDHVEVVYERDGAVWARSSVDGGVIFSAEQRVDKASGTQFSASPDVTIEPNTSDVFVAYHGLRADGGDTNIYANFSTDAGKTYQTSEVRIDDDASGFNQSNVSLATDVRTGHVMATWEDRRGGSNVYFSRSIDGGLTWEANLNSGAGLTGDQFTPRAEVDPGRNVFVFFVDTSAGHRPLFNRFNALGSFDIPAEVSSTAGTAGAAAKGPVLTIDKFGRAFVAWSENRDSPVDNVYFARGE